MTDDSSFKMVISLDSSCKMVMLIFLEQRGMMIDDSSCNMLIFLTDVDSSLLVVDIS